MAAFGWVGGCGLTPKELAALPTPIYKKIDAFFSKQVANVKKLEIDRSYSDQLKNNLSESENAIKNLEKQLNLANAALVETQAFAKDVETQLKNAREERDASTGEHRNWKMLAEKRQSEIDDLKSNAAELLSQLQKAIDEKCEAVAKNDEIQNKAAFLEQKEKRLQQERVLQNDRMQNLTDDLNKYRAELQTIRTDCDVKVSELESKLTRQSDELNDSKQKIFALSEKNDALVGKANDLTRKMVDQSQMEEGILENYKKEIDAKTELTVMYQKLYDDSNKKCVELSDRIMHLEKTDSSFKAHEIIGDDGNSRTTEKNNEISKEKDELILSLKNELNEVNSRLKTFKKENLNLFLEDLTPAAYETCNLLKTMSLTQIYEQLINLSDELSNVKKENVSNVQIIVSLKQEVEEKNNELNEYISKYNNLLENNEQTKQKNNELVTECSKVKSELVEYSANCDAGKMENLELKSEIKDLSRQVCFLLQEIESKNDSICANESVTDDSIFSSSISKKLVTFKDIEELQANNIYLLKLVNDLKNKLKDSRRNVESSETGDVIEMLKTRISDLSNSQEQQIKIIDALTLQRDRYKDLYNESCKNVTNNHNEKTLSPKMPTPVSISQQNISDSNSTNNDLELEIIEVKKKLEKQAADFAKYKEEIGTNEKILSDQLDSTQKKFTDLSKEYAKCVSTSKINSEMYENLKHDINIYKKQISSLEERNKLYDVSIVKQEETIRFLRDEVMDSLTKLTKSDMMVERLQQECKFLKDSENRLKKERDLLQKERYSHSLLINDIELIKVSEERKQLEKGMNLETKLKTLQNEYSELEKQLKINQEKIEEMKSNCERQVMQLENNLTDCKSTMEKKDTQINLLNEQIQVKTSVIEDLNKRMLNLISVSSDTGSLEFQKRIKDLENQLQNYQVQNECMQYELTGCKENLKQKIDEYNMNVEKLKNLEITHVDFKKTVDNRVKSMMDSENSLKEKIQKLETQLSFQPHDVNLMDSNELKIKVINMANKLEELEAELIKKNNSLQLAEGEKNSLLEALKKAETKYSNEVILHSADVKILSELKNKLIVCNSEIAELNLTKSRYENELSEYKIKLKEFGNQSSEKYVETKSLLCNLKEQNSLLHEQLQSFKSQKVNTESDFSKNSENANNKNLLEIIKRIKDEKDMFEIKLNMISAERDRLKLEMNILENKISSMKTNIATESKQKASNSVLQDITSLSNRIETLTDSNIILRREKDKALKDLKTLSESTDLIKRKLEDMQNSNNELTAKVDVLQSENANLKTEVNRWRSRANTLVEKANKQSPEDWKRLQNERETLAKMLTCEKENTKKSNEEMLLLKTEKSNIDEQINKLSEKNNLLSNENSNQLNELSTIKSDISKITQELMAMKTLVTEKSESNEMLGKKLENTEKDLQHMRRIANKYKTKHDELVKSIQEKENAKEITESAALADDSLKDKIEKEEKILELENIINKLNEQISKLQEDINNIDKIKQEYETLQSHFSQVAEEKNGLNVELSEIKLKLDELILSREKLESNLTNLQGEHDEDIKRIENEKTLIDQSKSNEIIQLQRKNKFLLQKINQLQKNFGNNHSPKPSTSFVQENINVIEFPDPNSKSSTETRSSDISSSPSSSQNVTENLPSSSSTSSHSQLSQFHDTSLPPESTQDLDSENTREIGSEAGQVPITVSGVSFDVPQASSSSSNSNNSNSTVTTSHGNDDSNDSQRSHKRSRQNPDQAEDISNKRIKMQRVAESELEYQVPTSSQRDQEDECIVVVDSGDDENQCGNSCQELTEDDDNKMGKKQRTKLEDRGSTVSRTSMESSEVELVDNMSIQGARSETDRSSTSTSQGEISRCSSLPTSNREQQIETISSVTEGTESTSEYLSLGVGVGSAGVSGAYDEGSDSIVPSTPVLYLPRRNDGFGEAVSSPITDSGSGREGCFTFTESSTGSNVIGDTHADLTSQIGPQFHTSNDEKLSESIEEKLHESSEAEAETEDTSNDNNTIDEEVATVSSQGNVSAPSREAEESSEAEASTTETPNVHRGNWRRGQSQRLQTYGSRIVTRSTTRSEKQNQSSQEDKK